jgi:hypothetical protein
MATGGQEHLARMPAEDIARQSELAGSTSSRTHCEERIDGLSFVCT